MSRGIVPRALPLSLNVQVDATAKLIVVKTGFEPVRLRFLLQLRPGTCIPLRLSGTSRCAFRHLTVKENQLRSISLSYQAEAQATYFSG